MNKHKIKLCLMIILCEAPEVIVDAILNQVEDNDEFAMEIENALLDFSKIDNFA